MEKNPTLDPLEARLFGVLIEKALTTPEHYPLTVNAATNGANQKSNRDPVLDLDETETLAALDRLVAKYLARRVYPGNSRVEKFCHNGKDALNLPIEALAVMAELLLRGPQTLGELRGRCSRMVPLESLEQVQGILAPLTERGFVRSLPPHPGSRAERYAQLLSPDSHPLTEPPERAETSGPVRESMAERLNRLEERVAELERQMFSLTGRGPEPTELP